MCHEYNTIVTRTGFARNQSCTALKVAPDQ